MVDAEDGRLVEVSQQDAVEGPRRGEVGAKRLFDDDAGAARASRLAEPFHDAAEQRGRDGEVVGRVLGRSEFLAQGRERGRVLVIAVHVAQEDRQLTKGRLVEPAVLLHAVARPRLELLQRPACPGHADHRHTQVTAADHRLQRRENLLVRQVARSAEENQGVGVRFAHGASPFIDSQKSNARRL